MRYTHIVKYHSGNESRHEFRNKTESDNALRNAKRLADTFGTITSVEVQATNFPQRKSVYTF